MPNLQKLFNLRKPLPLTSFLPLRPRPLSTTTPHTPPKTHQTKPSKHLPPLAQIPEHDLLETFLKGSGPGGQKINKTHCAVQLKHIPTGIVQKSQATRSRSQNRKICRRLLAERLEVVEKGEESRVKIKEDKIRRKKEKKRRKGRKKYGMGKGGADEEDGKEGEYGGEEEDEGDAEERKDSASE